MTDWQYRNQRDRAPAVRTDEGYFVKYPYDRHEQPTSAAYRHTIQLQFQGNMLNLWAHEIGFNFSIAGSFAQSPFFREFYPHNMVAPTITIAGQTSSQWQYGEMTEWIRKAQRWTVKPPEWVKGTLIETHAIGLTIPRGGIQYHQHTGHHFRGHITNIQRQTSRYVNAPEFQFEYIVAAAYSGIFDQHSEQEHIDELAQYMQLQSHSRRRGGHVRTVMDPDLKQAPDPDTGNQGSSYTKSHDGSRPD